MSVSAYCFLYMHYHYVLFRTNFKGTGNSKFAVELRFLCYI